MPWAASASSKGSMKLGRHPAHEEADVAGARGADACRRRGCSRAASRVMLSMKAAMVSARTGPMVPTLRSPSSGSRSGGTARAMVRAPSRVDLACGTATRGRGLGSSSGSEKTSSKRSLTKARTEGTVRKLVVRAQDFPTGGFDEALHLLVDRDVGPAEAVDGLLGVADDEELAGLEADVAPVGGGLGVRVLGEEEGDLAPGGGRCPGTRPRGRSRSGAGSSGGRGWSRVRTSRVRSRRSWKSTTARSRLRLLVGVEEAAEAVAQRPGEVGVGGVLPGRPGPP